MSEMRERTEGILIGLAAGDRNGGPIQIALRLAESLAARSGFDPDDVFSRYRAWYETEGFDTGPVMEGVMRLVATGMPRADAVDAIDARLQGETAGCNPAHRAAPLAMCQSLVDVDLPPLASIEARLTHAHPLAGAASAFVVTLCRRLATGEPFDEAMHYTQVEASAELKSILAEPARRLSIGGFAPETLRAALHFLTHGESFDDALDSALAFAGAANYCPVLVGSIGGARWGTSAIGDRHLKHVADLERLRTAAALLASK